MVHCPQFTTHYLPTRLSHCTLHDSRQTSPLRLFITCHLTCCHSLLNFTAIVAYIKQVTFCFVPATDGEKLARCAFLKMYNELEPIVLLATRAIWHLHLLCVGLETFTPWRRARLNRHLLVFTTARNWPRGPHNFGGEAAGGNKTGGTVGCGDTDLISPVAWPLSAVGVLISVLASPTRWETWGTAMSDVISSIRPGLLAVRFLTSTLGNF